MRASAQLDVRGRLRDEAIPASALIFERLALDQPLLQQPSDHVVGNATPSLCAPQPVNLMRRRRALLSNQIQHEFIPGEGKLAIFTRARDRAKTAFRQCAGFSTADAA